MKHALRIENFGDKAVGVTLKGDLRTPEPEAFRVMFPWGHVEVTRAVDSVPHPDYWVHVHVNHPESSTYCPDANCGEYSGPGAIKAARLDQVDRHAAEANLGDFARSELYHLAVRVGAGRRLEAPDA